jgi:hypothetical protein
MSQFSTTPDNNTDTSQILANTLLSQLEGQQGARVRNQNAQMQVELGMIRAALPNPNQLLAIAHTLDTLLPHDDEPEMQTILREWAQHIYAVTRSDQAGHVAYDALSKALKYADIMKERQAPGPGKGDNPQLAQQSIQLHQEMMAAIEAVRALFTGDDSHGEVREPTGNNGQG